jgi:hypothetical protein
MGVSFLTAMMLLTEWRHVGSAALAIAVAILG